MDGYRMRHGVVTGNRTQVPSVEIQQKSIHTARRDAIEHASLKDAILTGFGGSLRGHFGVGEGVIMDTRDGNRTSESVLAGLVNTDTD
jgi:hypothetical protein